MKNTRLFWYATILLLIFSTNVVAGTVVNEGGIMYLNVTQMNNWNITYQRLPVYTPPPKITQPSIRGPIFTSVNMLNGIPYIAVERDQGDPGTCWVWAATAEMEHDHFVKNGVFERLSIEYLTTNWVPPSASLEAWAGEGGSPDEFLTFYQAHSKAVPWSNPNAWYADGNSNPHNWYPNGTLRTVSDRKPWFSGAMTGEVADQVGTNPHFDITAMQLSKIDTPNQAQAILNIKQVLDNNKLVEMDFAFPNHATWGSFKDFYYTGSNTSSYDLTQFSGAQWNSSGGEGGSHATVIYGYDDADNTWLVLNSWNLPPNRPQDTFRVPEAMNYDCSYQDPTPGNPPIRDLYFTVLDTTFAAHTPATNTILVTPSVNPSKFGQSITYTVTVTASDGSTPLGSIRFNDGSIQLGTADLSDGTASLTTSTLSVGNHAISADYLSWDQDLWLSSSSTPFNQVVQKATTMTAVTGPAQAGGGSAITFMATVTPVAPGAGTLSGMVTFKDGVNTIGAGMLAMGSTTFTTSTLSVGNHQISAFYGGDAHFLPSQSSVPVAITITKPPVITFISPISGIHGKPVRLAILGNYFQPGAIVSLSRGGSWPLPFTVTATPPSQIVATMTIPNDPTLTGKWNVVVANPDHGAATKQNIFTIQ